VEAELGGDGVLDGGAEGEGRLPLGGAGRQFVRQFGEFVGKADVPKVVEPTFLLYLPRKGALRLRMK
jgi:hypothetical protein